MGTFESLEHEDTDIASDLLNRAIRELEHALQQLRQAKTYSRSE